MTSFQKFSLIVLVGLAIAVAAVLNNYQLMYSKSASSSTHSVVVGGARVSAEIAQTPQARMQGLSGRLSLPEDHAMLFIFDSEDFWGLWMKDMKFPIDIVWGDKNGVIVTIEKNVTPESYPKTFLPSKPSLYVLEVPAGFADIHALAEGDKIVVQ